MKILIGSDHGGYELKERVKELLLEREAEVVDVGCNSADSTDYPDFAIAVSEAVSADTDVEGILICTTGLGMSMVANRFRNVRAANCLNPDMACLARKHNDANLLVLGARYVAADNVKSILDSWLDNTFSEAERHARRIGKLEAAGRNITVGVPSFLQEVDIEVYEAIAHEAKRQNSTINLIASENYVSGAVAEAQGSVMTNKYAEGYPGKRWYNGCDFIDDAESLAIERAKKLFGADHANVQPHCGSSANMAVYFSVLKPGDTILSMDLSHGGHLTHGNAVNFSGKLFNFKFYGVERDTGCIDYEKVADKAFEVKPKLIVAGASAYSRTLDFEKFRQIADSVGAMLMVDMAHICGLIAAGCHPSPVPFAEFVTTTTHKTLRGPRGGMILCRAEYADAIDHQVFPGIQGGPLMHEIAAKAVCLNEALQPSFKKYGEQIVKNAACMADYFISAGYQIVSGGTDNHLMLLNLENKGLTGKDAALALDKAGIIVNKNAIPFDTKSPFVTSGIRIGTPAVTTIGMKEEQMVEIATLIDRVLQSMGDEKVIQESREQIVGLRSRFAVVPSIKW